MMQRPIPDALYRKIFGVGISDSATDNIVGCPIYQPLRSPRKHLENSRGLTELYA